MALKISTQFRGIPVPMSYCSVGSVCFPSDSKTQMAFVLHYRASAEVDVAFSEMLYQAPYVLDGPNPYKQAYEYLKTLPEFLGAVDC